MQVKASLFGRFIFWERCRRVPSRAPRDAQHHCGSMTQLLCSLLIVWERSFRSSDFTVNFLSIEYLILWCIWTCKQFYQSFQMHLMSSNSTIVVLIKLSTNAFEWRKSSRLWQYWSLSYTGLYRVPARAPPDAQHQCVPMTRLFQSILIFWERCLLSLQILL